MGVLKKMGEFLFGKNPDIFDDKGQVLHQHPEKFWQDWKNKHKSDPAYNWRNHTGMKGGRSTKN